MNWTAFPHQGYTGETGRPSEKEETTSKRAGVILHTVRQGKQK